MYRTNVKKDNHETNLLELTAHQRTRERNYWLNRLSGELGKTGFFSDKRPIPRRMKRDFMKYTFPGQVFGPIWRLANQSDYALNVILLAGTAALLYRYTAQNHIVIAVPIFRQDGARELINKVLPIRVDFTEGMSFRELLLLMRQRLNEAEEHQNYPMPVLARQLGYNGNLFEVAVLLENVHDRGYLEDTEVDISFVFNRAEELAVEVEYNSWVYQGDRVKQVMGHLVGLLAEGAQYPGKEIDMIDILDENEQEQILVQFNARGAEYPQDKPIHQLFIEQVERTPDRLALDGRTECGEEIQVTYRELAIRSGQLARILQETGVKRNTIVVLMVERSVEMIIGILATLKAGGVYLPINPRNPAERIVYILTDSGADVLIAVFNDRLVLFNFQASEQWVKTYSEGCMRPSDTDRSPVLPPPSPADEVEPVNSIAYVIYTSGSTGNPKGVAVSHRNFCPLLHWGYRHIGLGPGDHAAQNLSYYFDWSVWEIFITITSGATLCLVDRELLLDAGKYVRMLNQKRITVLHITPTQYRYLVNTGQKLLYLRILSIGAEKLSLDLVRCSLAQVPSECRIFNMYGPTEATIMSAVLEIDRSKLEEYEELSSVPIGRPISNLHLTVLNRCLRPQPSGVTGELFIAGDGVAGGYLNNPELTAERFVDADIKSGAGLTQQSPSLPAKTVLSFACGFTNCGLSAIRFSMPVPGIAAAPRLYKTGDLCRWLDDGNIEFLGRIDSQVKIRGFRIELGEIETQMMKHPAVKEAVVIVWDEAEGKGEKYLCAYLVIEPEQSIEIPSLRDFLSKSLPDYMVPTCFVFLDSFPLNPNGKVDLKALPEPGFNHQAATYVVPQDEFEWALADIWSELLGIDRSSISTDRSFFELGGHSLKANLMIDRIYKRFGVEIPLARIFKISPTIREIASFVRTLQWMGNPENKIATVKEEIIL